MGDRKNGFIPAVKRAEKSKRTLDSKCAGQGLENARLKKPGGCQIRLRASPARLGSLGKIPKKIQRYQKSCREGHLNISTTLPVQIQNSADLERAAAAQLKSVEFSICTERVLETIHIHSNFTAGEMLQLFGNLPHFPLRFRSFSPHLRAKPHIATGFVLYSPERIHTSNTTLLIPKNNNLGGQPLGHQTTRRGWPTGSQALLAAAIGAHSEVSNPCSPALA